MVRSGRIPSACERISASRPRKSTVSLPLWGVSTILSIWLHGAFGAPFVWAYGSHQKGKETVSELPNRYCVHPTMIHLWKKALLEGVSGVFERGSRMTPIVDEERVKDLHAKIGDLAVANDFLARYSSTWISNRCFCFPSTVSRAIVN